MTFVPVLQELVVLLGAAVVVIVLSRKVRLPPVVGFLATGMAVGPSGLGWIDHSQHIEAFAEIGIVLLLFGIGLEVSTPRLRKLGRLLVVGGSLQVALTVAVVALVAWAFDAGPAAALFYGFVAALSSTAIVLKRYVERRELDAPHARVATGILLFQDLLIVPLLLIVPVLGGAGEASALVLALRLGGGMLVVALAFVVGRFVVPAGLQVLAETGVRELLLLAALSACFGGALLTERLGFSMALGAFLAGVLIADSQFQHHVLAETGPLRDVFNSLFFVSVGMLVHWEVVLEHPGPIVGLSVGVMALKAAILVPVVAVLGFPTVTRLGVALALAQIGELSFLLAHAGHRYGLVDDARYELVVASIVLTMLLTPALIALHPWLAARLARSRAAGSEEVVPADTILIAGFGFVGRQLARVLASARAGYRIVDLDPRRVREARASGEPVIFGDATRPDIQRDCGVPTARACVFLLSDPQAQQQAVRVARALAPSVPILARAGRRDEIAALLAAGADQVVVDELEAAVETVTAMLHRLHVPGNVIRAEGRLLRADSYELLRSTRPAPLSDLMVRALAQSCTETFLLGAEHLRRGRSLGELELRTRTGATVIAVVRGERSLPNPGAGLQLEEGDVLVLLGGHAAIEAASRYLEAGAEDAERPTEG
ncbi:MAG: cation:proton antiporter [Acidobacteriota bacterium]|nr:cation:proton antiporter [Acidobacteriota bacterium]